MSSWSCSVSIDSPPGVAPGAVLLESVMAFFHQTFIAQSSDRPGDGIRTYVKDLADLPGGQFAVGRI